MLIISAYYHKMCYHSYHNTLLKIIFYQSDYFLHKSTKTELSRINLDILFQLNNNTDIIVILLDLSLVFNTFS